MDKLEVLALAESPAASRELAAMQALALKLADTDTTNPRLRSLARTLERDLEAALAGKAAPWSEARTRFEARKLARSLAAGPTFAHGITKTQLAHEWNVGIDTAIEMEAQAQAICMATKDFHRAFEAFAAKEKPVFEGD